MLTDLIEGQVGGAQGPSWGEGGSRQEPTGVYSLPAE